MEQVEVKRLTEEIDLGLLVFIERYATNLLKWDLLTFFGNHPEEKFNVEEVAKRIGRSYKAIRSELGDLAILELLHKSSENGQPVYQLTYDSVLRSQVIRFAQKCFTRPRLP
ncbi:MAG: hypothetical protein GWN00_36280 [Aliifodinibius sp.]|nr:hypothetical protein [Fodinibius sp.]NIV16077.1 hypothetical protein [Fodinibius sp.]NIY30050.1 hypothetical protein [Fodinibius sp.]